MSVLYDFESGEIAHIISENMAIDGKGKLLIRMGDNMAMNMDTGNIHIVSDWDDDDDD